MVNAGRAIFPIIPELAIFDMLHVFSLLLIAVFHKYLTKSSSLCTECVGAKKF